MEKPKFWLPARILWNSSGRINRLQYIAYFAIWLVTCLAILLATNVILWASRTFGMEWLTIGLTVLFGYGLFCLQAKRLHDMNGPAIVAAFPIGSNIVMTIVTVVMISGGHFPMQFGMPLNALSVVSQSASGLLSLVLFLGSGTTGPNTYGANPSQPAPSAAEAF